MAKKISMGLVVLILAVLLVAAVAYIGYNAYAQKQIQKEMNIYQQGVQIGTKQVVATIFKQVDECKQVPIFYNNQTLNLVATKCLKK